MCARLNCSDESGRGLGSETMDRLAEKRTAHREFGMDEEVERDCQMQPSPPLPLDVPPFLVLSH